MLSRDERYDIDWLLISRAKNNNASSSSLDQRADLQRICIMESLLMIHGTGIEKIDRNALTVRGDGHHW
jgi:hypothetical protein